MEDEQAEGSESPIEPELLATFTEIGIVETRRAIEAILLVATDPTPASLLAQLIEVPVEHVELLCHALADSYEEANHGFQLVNVAGGWRFQTHPDMAPYVERFAMDGQSTKLSNAALETLAIVAYKQPISRAQVSAIRGVNVDAVLRTLVQRGYVDEVGRDTGAGQAVLFGTTSMFLERLGINTVSDLPALGDFVPSAEVVEALEQTLKVNLDPDPDLTITDLDRDDGPARPPAPADADTAGDADGVGDADEAAAQDGGAEPASTEGGEPGVEATEVEAEDAPEAEAAAEPAADVESAAEPADDVESEPAAESADEVEPDADEVAVAEAGDDEPAAVADEDADEVEAVAPVAPPENERVAEQRGEPTTVAPDPVVALEGVVVDADASPKSGAYRADLPLGPGGEPPGQVGGGQPGMVGPTPAPVADTRAGGAPGGGEAVPHGAGDPVLAPGRVPVPDTDTDTDGNPEDLSDPDRPGAEPGEQGPAAGRADHPVPAGDPSERQPSVQPDPAVGPGTPAPTAYGQADGQPSGVAGDAAPGDDAHHHPGGPGLAGPVDTPVPPAAGPGPDLTSEPVVDLRPPIDLTEPATSPDGELAPDADRA